MCKEFGCIPSVGFNLEAFMRLCNTVDGDLNIPDGELDGWVKELQDLNARRLPKITAIYNGLNSTRSKALWRKV